MKHAINVTLRLPDDYQVPQTGAGDYAISIEKLPACQAPILASAPTYFRWDHPGLFLHIVPDFDPAVAGTSFR
ncbi:hypothetical protein THH46_05925 [Pseudomonas sp. NA13]